MTTIVTIAFFCGGVVEKKNMTTIVTIPFFYGGVVKKKTTIIITIAFFCDGVLEKKKATTTCCHHLFIYVWKEEKDDGSFCHLLR